MPENYYCLDNFFQKMTDLESPRKNNDCYFYYYSTCTKGDNCTFRHEPSALGCETTCSFWKEGKCINVHCNFRHMELRKNRKTIPCYWESQPSGCKKPHCPFMHISKKDGDGEDQVMTDEHDDMCNLKIKKDDFKPPVVDPIVVNFEEESDNESTAPTQSSHQKKKMQLNAYHEAIDFEDRQIDFVEKSQCDQSDSMPVEVKTLEEIKLDRIQAESAAYYSYIDENNQMETKDSPNARRGNIFKRLQPLEVLLNQEKTKEVNIESIQVLTLDEIRKRKRKNNDNQEQRSTPEEDSQNALNVKRSKEEKEFDSKSKVVSTTTTITTKRKVLLSKNKQNNKNNLCEIKIKTLAEIKAEKQKRKLQEISDTQNETEDECISNKKHKLSTDTTIDKEQQEENIVSSTSKNDETQIQIEQIPKAQCVVAPLQRQLEPEHIPENINNIKLNLPRKSDEPKLEKATLSLETIEEENVTSNKCITEGDNNAIITNEEKKEVNLIGNIKSKLDDSNFKIDDSKLDDLLLDDDDEDVLANETLTLKAEDDILNDIDNLLKE